MRSEPPRQWYGIRTNVTDVLSDFGMPQTQIGTDMRVQGELQRRPGFQSTSIAQQAGPIRYIISAFPPGRPFVTFDVLAPGNVVEIDGLGPPPPPPPPPKKKRPEIIVQDPNCASGGYATVNHASVVFPSISGLIGADGSFSEGSFSITEGCCYRCDVDLTVVMTDADNEFTLTAGFVSESAQFILLDQCGGAVTVWNGSNIFDGPLTKTYQYTGYFCSLASVASANISYSVSAAAFGSVSISGSIRLTNVLCVDCC